MPRTDSLIKHFGASGPEAQIQEAIMRMLRGQGWFVKETHGNMYQCGFPDLFATHIRYGHRWIEVKNPTAYRFTPAQLETFPLLCAHGSRVWVLVADTDAEYQKLFAPANWHYYLEIMK